MASTEKPVSMMFLRTLDAKETRPSRLPSITGTAGPPVWFFATKRVHTQAYHQLEGCSHSELNIIGASSAFLVVCNVN
jgi:hypothetical protein